MIGSWMAWSLAVSGLFGIAALLLEIGMGTRGFPLRRIWIVALLASASWSAAPWFTSARTPEAGAFAFGSLGSSAGSNAAFELAAITFPGASVMVDASRSAVVAGLDSLLLWIWGATSLMLIVLVVGTLIRLDRQYYRWRPAVVDTVQVMVATNMGPAVAGFLYPTVVIPEWLLTAEPSRRSLVIAHEQEHIRARDMRWIALGVALVVAMPWNIALWWQFRRLKRAIEMDCDTRVLRRCADRRAYARALVDIGLRTRSGMLTVGAGAGSPSLLEMRVKRILEPQPMESPVRRTVVLATVAACLMFAGAAPTPEVAWPGKLTTTDDSGEVGAVGAAQPGSTPSDGQSALPSYRLMSVWKLCVDPTATNAYRRSDSALCPY